MPPSMRFLRSGWSMQRRPDQFPPVTSSARLDDCMPMLERPGALYSAGLRPYSFSLIRVIVILAVFIYSRHPQGCVQADRPFDDGSVDLGKRGYSFRPWSMFRARQCWSSASFTPTKRLSRRSRSGRRLPHLAYVWACSIPVCRLGRCGLRLHPQSR